MKYSTLEGTWEEVLTRASYLELCLDGTWFIFCGNHHHPIPARVLAPALPILPLHFLIRFPIPYCPWIPCQTYQTVQTLRRVPIRAQAPARTIPILQRFPIRFPIPYPPYRYPWIPCQTCRSSPSVPQVSTARLRPNLPPLFPLPNDLRAACHEPVRDGKKHGIG